MLLVFAVKWAAQYRKARFVSFRYCWPNRETSTLVVCCGGWSWLLATQHKSSQVNTSQVPAQASGYNNNIVSRELSFALDSRKWCVRALLLFTCCFYVATAALLSLLSPAITTLTTIAKSFRHSQLLVHVCCSCYWFCLLLYGYFKIHSCNCSCMLHAYFG